MTTPPRITRPLPERTQPNRSWSTVLDRPAPAANGAAPADAADPVSRAVSLGYRVVDEYIRQGERAARAFGTAAAPGAPGGDLQHLTARMGQYAQDLLGAWMQLIELAGATNGRPAPPAAEATAPAPPTAEPTRIRIEVTSARPVEVELDLRPDADRTGLLVHDLRPGTPDAPRLRDVVIEAGDPPRLRVCVPAEQPAGIYHGVVVEERTNRAVGTVSVRIAT